MRFISHGIANIPAELNSSNREDALNCLCSLWEAYRTAQVMARGNDDVSASYRRVAASARRNVQIVIFTVRENDFEGTYA